jgi:hypothetical protein
MATHDLVMVPRLFPVNDVQASLKHAVSELGTGVEHREKSSSLRAPLVFSCLTAQLSLCKTGHSLG